MGLCRSPSVLHKSKFGSVPGERSDPNENRGYGGTGQREKAPQVIYTQSADPLPVGKTANQIFMWIISRLSPVNCGSAQSSARGNLLHYEP